jgi:hypothetical protein
MCLWIASFQMLHAEFSNIVGRPARDVFATMIAVASCRNVPLIALPFKLIPDRMQRRSKCVLPEKGFNYPKV